MEPTIIAKRNFACLGKEGEKINEKNLWEELNKSFKEVSDYAKKYDDGTIFAYWGIDNSNNKYFAGVEVKNDSPTPKGWVKKDIQAYEYVKVVIEDDKAYEIGMNYIKEKKLKLIGPVFIHNDPKNNEKSIWFPVRSLAGAIWN